MNNNLRLSSEEIPEMMEFLMRETVDFEKIIKAR